MVKPLRRIAPSVAAVPRLWPDSTIVCIASGPSLTDADVAGCRGRARVIVVNDNYRKAPWADALYAADAAWWTQHPETQAFAGLKYSIGGGERGRPADVTILRNTGSSGLERDPAGLRTGGHSGYQAVNLAVHLGARTIVLLGYDLQQTHGKAHWFGKHVGLRDTNPALYPKWAQAYATLVEPLAALGVSVVNCTRQSAMTCFPRAPLVETLAGCQEAVAS